MAGQTNDHELLALARTNKALALQATVAAPKMFTSVTNIIVEIKLLVILTFKHQLNQLIKLMIPE